MLTKPYIGRSLKLIFNIETATLNMLRNVWKKLVIFFSVLAIALLACYVLVPENKSSTPTRGEGYKTKNKGIKKIYGYKEMEK